MVNKNQNPIEKAIGKRAKDPMTIPKAKEPTPSTNSPPNEVLDEPTQEEMLSLEDLNRQTEERLLNNNPTSEEEHLQQQIKLRETAEETTPVSKPDPQPAIKTSTQESQPPQKSESDIQDVNKPNENLDTLSAAKNQDAANASILAESLNQKKKEATKTPAEDEELTLLKEYILDNGFNESAVAMHIVMLCSQPLVTPLTTSWDFADRASIPDMVLNILKTSGYLEGIWPSLRIVMATNKANTAWTAEIAITLAYFDCIRTLPVLQEMQNDN